MWARFVQLCANLIMLDYYYFISYDDMFLRDAKGMMHLIVPPTIEALKILQP